MVIDASGLNVVTGPPRAERLSAKADTVNGGGHYPRSLFPGATVNGRWLGDAKPERTSRAWPRREFADAVEREIVGRRTERDGADNYSPG